jgi:predicted YcjX-like family ATPase
MWQRVARSRHNSSRQTVRPTDPGDNAAQDNALAEREQKMAALNHVQEAWAEARLDGVDDDCMAMTCLFAAFAELVSTYGEEAAAQYADSLSKRIRNGEFTLDRTPQ